MNLSEYFKIKEFLEIYLTDKIFVFISVEDDEIIIEMTKDKNFFEKINIEHLVDINMNTKVEDVKDIIIYTILERYILEHM